MKRIGIKKYVPPDPQAIYTRDQLYWVYLGNGTRHSFTRKRDALAFLAETNRFLNLKLMECNLMLGELYTEYRHNWPYLDDIQLCARCQDYFHGITQAMDLLVTRSDWSNGNVFVWLHFNTILSNMLGILDLISDIHQDKNKYAELARAGILKSRINWIRDQLDGYKKENAPVVIDQPVHVNHF